VEFRGPAPGRAELTFRWALLLAAAFVLVAGGSPLAESLASEAAAVCLETAPARSCGGAPMEAKFDARFSPKELAKSEQTPLSPWVSMRFIPSEGARLPALKGFEIEEDRHLRLNLNGVPICSPGNVDEMPTKQRCKDAVIGEGKMVTNVVFPEVTIPPIHSELTVYNGGRKNGVRTLFLDAFITVPTPAEIVTWVKVRHSDLGRHGLKLVGSVPKIAGGSGSIESLAWRFHKSVFSATCPADRQLDTHFNTTFADGTLLAGTVARPCMPGS